MKNLLILLTITLTFRLSAQTSSCNTTDIFDDANVLTNQVCYEVIDNLRYFYSNNYPNHSDNYNQPQFSVNDEGGDYDYSYTMCAYPQQAASFTPLYEETESTGCTDTYEFGVSLNGVRFDPSSAVTFVANEGESDEYNNLDWHVEASSSTNSIGANMGIDNGGHLNPSGEYHYHAVPKDYFENDLGIDGSAHSIIVGYAADGFPIYYKYVFVDDEDGLSAIETATSGYSLKSGNRVDSDGNATDGITAPDGLYDGGYYEDYEYNAANTILDECNGRYGITPDFPYGTYYYVITDEYPFVPRCFKGSVLDNTFRVGPDASCLTDKNATQDDCSALVSGCMDPFSDNYNANANSDDNSCTYSDVTWTGTWSNADGPNSEMNTSVSSDYTFSSNGVFECNNLTIGVSATLTVDNNSTLVINGHLTNSGAIVVESGSSLITYSSQSFSGNSITYKRNTRYADGKYSYVGTPVKQDAGTTGSSLGTTVYKYNETTSYVGDTGLSRWENATSDELVPGRGYAQAFQQKIVFTGVPNSGTITFSGTYTEDSRDNVEGFNLVANPYMAAIDVHDFISENDNITGSLYLWDDNGSAIERGANADYIIVNSLTYTQNSRTSSGDRYNEHIASTQGFFVQLNDNTDTDITFTEGMRVSGSNEDGAFFREEGVPLVRLNLTNTAGLFKQTVIAWKEDANDDWNRLYDALAFDQSAESGIYSQKENHRLAIQALSEYSLETTLIVAVEEKGDYSIELGNSYESGSIFLLDTYLNTSIDLTQEAYSFHMNKGNNNNRFVIQKEGEILNKELLKVKVWQAIVSNHQLIVKPQNMEKSAEIKLISLSGNILKSASLHAGSTLNFGSFETGIYIISDGTRSQKVLMK